MPWFMMAKAVLAGLQVVQLSLFHDGSMLKYDSKWSKINLLMHHLQTAFFLCG